jgi:hypothetical protein
VVIAKVMEETGEFSRKVEGWTGEQKAAIQEAVRAGDQIMVLARVALEKIRESYNISAPTPRQRLDVGTLMNIESCLSSIADNAHQLASYRGIDQK